MEVVPAPPKALATVAPFADERVAAAEIAPTCEDCSRVATSSKTEQPASPALAIAGYDACLVNPARFDRTTWILTKDWSREEAEYVADHEGGWDLCQLNTQGSGACGWFQLLPCPIDGLTPEGQIRGAYAKWLSCGGSFDCAWYRWWP